MKRMIAFFVLMCMLLLTGCQKDESPDRTAVNEREQIVIWSYYETQAQQDALDWLVNTFNVSQNEYTASWAYVPMTDFTKKLIMAYTEEALPDIALLDNPNMMDCIQMGMCEDMTDVLMELDVDKNYYPATLETVTYEGKMYGLPAVCNNLALIYNRQLLKDAGVKPPQTWEELKEAAKLLTDGETKGFLISAKEGEQGAFQLLPWILSTGERPENIGGEGTQQAFTYLNELMQEGYMTKNCVNLSQTDIAIAFIQKEAAIMENGPWVLAMLDASGIDYGICRLPAGEKSCTIVGGEDFAVMKGKNVDGAKAFFRFYDQNRVIGKFCQKSCALPTKAGVAEYDSENQAIFEEQMEDAIVRSSIPYWNRLSAELPEAFYKMMSGEKSPEEAAKQLKAENDSSILN